jgi:hypothetical protein
MPKKVWRKCMEFQSELDNGQLEWYKLLAGDRIAVKVGIIIHVDMSVI